MNIKCLELVQRKATKFVMKGTAMDNKNRLMYLHLLPLIMELEIADILFLIKSLTFPSEHFNNIRTLFKFCDNPTRSSSHFKLRHSFCKNQAERNFYFNRIPRLWNSLPSFDIDLAIATIKSRLRNFFWIQFISHFDPDNVCSYHYVCPCQKCSKLPISMHFTSFI